MFMVTGMDIATGFTYYYVLHLHVPVVIGYNRLPITADVLLYILIEECSDNSIGTALIIEEGSNDL